MHGTESFRSIQTRASQQLCRIMPPHTDSMISAITLDNDRTRHGISAGVTAIVVVFIISASAIVIVEIQASSNSAGTITKTSVEASTSSQQSLTGNLIQAGGGQPTFERISLDNYNYQSVESGVLMTVRDTGSTTITISTISVSYTHLTLPTICSV